MNMNNVNRADEMLHTVNKPLQSRVYWEGWFYGCYVKAEDWYKDNLVYVNVRVYHGSTVMDRPDIERSFLLREADGFPQRLADYRDSISQWLIGHDEKRDHSGKLIPITLSLPLMGPGKH